MNAGIHTTLICGFLGAGKTTRINHLINTGELRNALFLVNDFGSINIDAELIEASDDAILRLNNGCACCGISGNLSSQLRDILRWPQPPERLVFEASGIARPRPLKELFAAARGYRLQGSETLVDASALLRHLADAAIADIVEAQIAEVGLLRVNRLAELDEQARDAVMHRLRAINPDASIELEPDREPACPAATPTDHSEKPQGPVVSETVQFPNPVDPASLLALLDAARPALLRAKGMVRSTAPDAPRQLIQFAGGRGRVTPTGPGNTQALVLIGHRSAQLDRLLAALRDLAAAQ